MKAQFANYLINKTKEFKYRLEDLVKVCNRSKGGPLKGGDNNINYKFSAFISLVMTFKDILSYLTDGSITWSAFDGVTHIDFIKGSRNAVTHDGTPIINAWVEGRCYSARDIIRFDQRGNEVIIECPTEDIRTVCLEFSESFAYEIRRMIAPLRDDTSLRKFLYTPDDFKQMSQHPAVPQDIRDRLPDQINTDTLPVRPAVHPIQEALISLAEIVFYCKSELKGT